MKIPLLPLATIILLPLLAGCQKKSSPAATVPRTDLQLSGHPRAAEAAARARPHLDRDLSAAALRLGDPIFIRAFKEEKILELHVENQATGKFDLFRSYKIAATSGTLGPKLREGDGQVPEGFYAVTPAAMNPDSRYHLSFNLGYPNDYDSSYGRTGSLIMIHGNQVSLGCLAMTDPKIEEIYTLADAALRNGQSAFQVEILPFRMTAARLRKSENDPNALFWQNLKQGDDLFEKNHRPPEIGVTGGRYVFRME